ncbi:hypothetical protein LR48_Vigan05g124600 [Vigna angularis]|uniref:DUF8039 domain-containing protein n=1 Tax=Phaseolus angularis TaxID=3914 RepID=A0A0L9ULR3_PHAAN|nr:hypothetical protein LR48_Vigan05g124600 [Vigna angularis]
MYTLGSTIHHETITADMMRVVVVDIRNATARVPVPTEDVQTVGQALGNFILWPLRLSRAIVKKCSRQPGSFECGYYVMRHMQKIISANVVDSWKLVT